MIYILCPPYLKTGGTELAHQFVFEASKIRDDVCIAYTKSEDGKYLNPAFEKYTKKYVLEEDIEDVSTNAIILPETLTRRVKKYKHIQKYIWWMSVDNYIAPKPLSMLYEQTGIMECIKEIYRRFKYPERNGCPISEMDSVKRHFVQSEYARLYLKEHGINNVSFLSDYINEDYNKHAEEIDINNKADLVLYNPAKGIKFTKKLIKYCPNIEFIPLKGMTNDEVIDYMKKAKVYIDFGNHPGKDRLPREAAVMDCCIITSKHGSAGNDIDVCIPSKYKFDCKKKDLKNIKALINNIFNNYFDYQNDYLDYKNTIKKEHDVFIKQVEEITNEL